MGQSVGISGVYRRLWSNDAEAIRDHFMRLPPESRHSRFGMGVSDDFVGRYAERAIAAENVLYGFFLENELRGLGELRPVNPQRLFGIGGEMEAAFSVDPAYQNNGIGGELMRLVTRAARVRCCKTLYLSFLTSNRPMRRIALSSGAEITTDQSESAARIAPELPNAVTLWNQAFDNASSISIAALDFQSRRFGAIKSLRS